MIIRLCQVLPLLLVGSSLVTDGWTQAKGSARHTSKTAVKMQTQEEGGLTVAFVDLPDGPKVSGKRVLDLGNVSFAGHPQNMNVQVRPAADRFVISANFGLMVQDPDQRVANATLLVAMAYPDSAHVLWLDGVRLSTALQVMPGKTPVGKTSVHRLQIEVPTALTEKDAAVHNSIIFQVIPN